MGTNELTKLKQKLLYSFEKANDMELRTGITERASWSYNKSKAVDYALKHCTDEPQYSANNGMGSDCANFVSKCIHVGGIKTDAEWYPASGESWGSDNWIRTGFYGNGGVVPYMTNKKYFKKADSISKVVKGSILYYTDKSHVALVTYKSGNVIKYSQHSNVKLSKKEAKNVVFNSKKESAEFYIPTK